MPKVKCMYHGMADEDISIHFEEHPVILGENPSLPTEKGFTFGSCMNSYSYLTPDRAEELGKQLIVAAAKKREDDSR